MYSDGKMLSKINADALTCVAFACFKDQTTGEFRYLGTVFLIGMRPDLKDDNKSTDIVWVTARHLLDGLKKHLCEYLYVRFNTESGKSIYVETKVADWKLSQFANQDVAFFKGGSPKKAKLKVMPSRQILTKDIKEKFQFDVTDEVAIIGLFANRVGNDNNIPIVRLGNIASPEIEGEPVDTKVGKMVAPLIEVRSIGGLSGSPVYVLLNNSKIINHKVKANGVHYYLYGLISGHFNCGQEDLNPLAESAVGLAYDRINSGIAVVSPIQNLLDTLSFHKFGEMPLQEFSYHGDDKIISTFLDVKAVLTHQVLSNPK